MTENPYQLCIFAKTLSGVFEFLPENAYKKLAYLVGRPASFLFCQVGADISQVGLRS